MQEDARIIKFGVQAFHTLFRQEPSLLQLFPFKDSQGRPIEAELRLHARVVIRAFTALLEGLNDLQGTARYLKDLVRCAACVARPTPSRRIMLPALSAPCA